MFGLSLSSLFPPAATQTVTGKGYSWGKILHIALQHKREIVLAQVIAALAAALSVPIPLFMPLLVDEVLLHEPAGLVHTMQALFPPEWHGPVLFIGAIFVLTIFLRLSSLALGVWETRQFTYIAKDIVYRIRCSLVHQLERVSMAEYESLGSGKVNSHLVTDLDTVDNFISAGISKLLIAALSIIGVACVLFWIHWQLAVFILMLNPLVIYITIRLGLRVKKLKSQENKAYSAFQQKLTDTLEAIQQIRAYNREKYYLGKVIEGAGEIKQHATAYAWKTDAANRLSFGVFLFGFDLFRSVGMLMVVFSDLSLGQMFAVFGYLWFMIGPMQEVLTIQYSYHSASAALKRINEMFELAWEPRYAHRSNPFANTEKIDLRVDKVSFSYDKQTPVLKNISLHIKAGEKVALVGASGGGKTTLVQIILGLYPAQSGQVYFNQIPVTETGLDVVRNNVATVLQHPALFNDSLRMNLTLGRGQDDKEIRQALRIARLDDFVAGLENGLDTVLGQHGIKLSGGQRQRVAVARMILSKPKVVILDEATSALDTETESELHHELDAFLRQKTTLIIAHRLSAVKQADRVLVVDQGKIIEQGKHEHLLESNGVYAKLYGSQLS